MRISRFAVIAALVGAPFSGQAAESVRINPAWKFHAGEIAGDPQAPGFDVSGWEDVALPHTFRETSLGLEDNMDDKRQATFDRTAGYYRRNLVVKDMPAELKHFLVFEGAMQTTELWVNGTRIGKYERTGYDTFSFEITSALNVGDNVITVKVDNRVNEATPPDGAKMPKDFVLFGGLYRDVSYVRANALRVPFAWEGKDAGVRVTFPEVSEEASSVRIATAVQNGTAENARLLVKTALIDAAGKVVAKLETSVETEAGKTVVVAQDFNKLAGIKLWSPDSPVLHTARTRIYKDGKEVESIDTRFGVRSVRFDAKQGFFLNGKPLKLQGSNRHQTWPFIGNAVPESLHRLDAEMIKNAGMNWIRLSHYPHDPDFLDACDELGLLALEEGPTWMGTNGPAWIGNLHESFRAMIRRDRNHPSIITWNACVNHAKFDHALGAIAAEEDDRPIGAQMPATPMDFNHGRISGNGALTIEHTGHTFPRGRGQVMKNGADGEYELAKRHWEHVSASMAKPDNSGMAVWAMFDYNTFHNIDEKGIVWHGVSDLTRLPKASYYWYQSEFGKKPIVYIRPHARGKAVVFSNCEKVEITADGKAVTPKPVAGLTIQHPPQEVEIPTETKELKVTGYIGGKKAAEAAWRKPGAPAAVQIAADAKSVAADGSDLVRVTARVVDAQGNPLAHLASVVDFRVEGAGKIVGTNPAPIRAGKAVVLVRPHYKTGVLKVTAASPELTGGSTTITVAKPPRDLDFPAQLPAFHAKEDVKAGDAVPLSSLQWTFEESQGQRWDRRFGIAPYETFKSGEREFKNALVANAPAQVVYHLGGLYRKMTVRLIAGEGVGYEFHADGRKILEKPELAADETVEVPLEGVTSLKLVAISPGGKKTQAVWENGMLTYGRARSAKVPDFDETAPENLAFDFGKAAAQPAAAAPEQVSFPPVKDAKAGEWVSSSQVMISGNAAKYPITIEGGEYRIYTEAWTDKPGSVAPGDAVTVRVKAVAGAAVAKVSIGPVKAEFKVEGK